MEEEIKINYDFFRFHNTIFHYSNIPYEWHKPNNIKNYNFPPRIELPRRMFIPHPNMPL